MYVVASPPAYNPRGPGLSKAVSIGKISDLSQFAKIFCQRKMLSGGRGAVFGHWGRRGAAAPGSSPTGEALRRLD